MFYKALSDYLYLTAQKKIENICQKEDNKKTIKFVFEDHTKILSFK